MVKNICVAVLKGLNAPAKSIDQYLIKAILAIHLVFFVREIWYIPEGISAEIVSKYALSAFIVYLLTSFIYLLCFSFYNRKEIFVLKSFSVMAVLVLFAVESKFWLIWIACIVIGLYFLNLLRKTPFDYFSVTVSFDKAIMCALLFFTACGFFIFIPNTPFLSIRIALAMLCIYFRHFFKNIEAYREMYLGYGFPVMSILLVLAAMFTSPVFFAWAGPLGLLSVGYVLLALKYLSVLPILIVFIDIIKIKESAPNRDKKDLP